MCNMNHCVGVIVFALVVVRLGSPVHGASPSAVASTLGELKARLLQFPTAGPAGAAAAAEVTAVAAGGGAGRYVEERMEAMSAQHSQRGLSAAHQLFRDQQQGHRINYILTLPGINHGTHNDVIYVLGTHYRTVSGDVTLSQEGSGTVALLEVTETLLSLRSGGCRFNATIVVVAFDCSADKKVYDGTLETGSRVFVEHHLPGLLKGVATFGGAYILGSLLNYNPQRKAQSMPTGFSFLPVPLLRELRQHAYRGDFILALSRHQALLSKVKQQWNTTAAWDSSCQITGDAPLPHSWPLSTVSGLGHAYSLHLMPLLFGGPGGSFLPVLTQVLDQYPWLLHGDHVPFWYHKHQLPTVFLTDTANLRKGACFDGCSPETLLTDDNLRFYMRTIRVVTDTLVRELTEGHRCVADDLRKSVTCSASSFTKLSMPITLFNALLAIQMH